MRDKISSASHKERRSNPVTANLMRRSSKPVDSSSDKSLRKKHIYIVQNSSIYSEAHVK